MADQFEVGYALLIGVSENAVPQLALPDVAKDIAALHMVLVHPDRCAYPKENVKVITGSGWPRGCACMPNRWPPSPAHRILRSRHAHVPDVTNRSRYPVADGVGCGAHRAHMGVRTPR